ncbi:hypothetical protein ACFR99_12195 [Haloarchaeobius amylolyticus]|uniref:Uncharacterized protein n=1 Tax=Haloarchaeobius amylolyticus TaxID=1198296 RepID=A0ABD6BI72_9EURY
MNVYKALFGIASVALGVLALLGSGVFSSRGHQDPDRSDQSETHATVQFDQNDVTSTRESSRSTTRREAAKRHVDPIFQTP